MISTEGGATRGSNEDPRYPPVDGQAVAEWTLWDADYMLDDAPDYYFATMTWLLAQQALDYADLPGKITPGITTAPRPIRSRWWMRSKTDPADRDSPPLR